MQTVPIYEYRCQDCGEVFEYMQRMSDDPKTTCEACSGTLERLISAAAFHLKGGGWYKDLYASPKKDASSSESSGESSGSDSSSSSGSKSSESKSSESKSSESKTSKSEPKPAAKSSSGDKS